MKKNLTEIVFILDRSGSMAGLESDTIGGFNGMVDKQKIEEGEALLSLVVFDDYSEVIYDRVDIKKVKKLTNKQYYVRGCTALLDAVGGAIKHISNVHKYIREEDRPEKTIFVITTDGMENASKKYNYEKVKNLVEKKKKENNWEFVFLGANIDAAKEASRFGIDFAHSANYNCDSEGTRLNFEVMGNVLSEVRCAKNANEVASVFSRGNVLESIRKDHSSRKSRR